ncbi:acetyl-CoA synthetase-like protein [Mycena maculata]|uniref:Acetyl-CoA synthetase-like protein n=1 Tax=Mycena maculata TaxID=230809 RepID=A0AAD7ISI2_9AGAR|nr:acetyl-CoA synthetase-like protein [Mycena maculata]
MPHFLQGVLPLYAKYSTSPLIKCYVGKPGSPAWDTTTYGKYLDDLRIASSYWSQRLSAEGVSAGAVVGLWLRGTIYSDLVNLYAVSAAGFVPQVFSVKFSRPGRTIILDLLAACDGKALLLDPTFSDAINDATIPTIEIPVLSSHPPVAPGTLEAPSAESTDLAMIFHTSGTTGGKPKPVRCDHHWMVWQAISVDKIWQGSFGPDIMNNLGSFAHVGTASSMNYLPLRGSCLVQTSRSDFSAEEFMALVNEQGMNRMFIYADWLVKLASIARADEKVLAALRGMRQIAYTGAAINPEVEKWLVGQNVPISTMYATTEVSPALVSNLADRTTLPAMRVMPGVDLTFIPASNVTVEDLDGDAAGRSKGGILYDVFIPASSKHCPHPTVMTRADGHITGDLFEEVQPGYYAFRGRNDDWIRTGPGLVFCDTKSIEDNIRITCPDIVRNCTVVGHYKPAVVLFIEAVSDSTTPDDVLKLKDEVLRRTAAFNSALFPHERIVDREHIVVVPSGVLPRTKEKGNIRRKAVEEDYAGILEQIYTGGGASSTQKVAEPERNGKKPV